MIPFITQRKGEEAAPANLYHLPRRGTDRLRLFYGDEDVRDRPVRDLLWARCSFRMNADGMPTGAPQWKFMHPYRQMATMLANRCQVCTAEARTPIGYVFLAGPKDQDSTDPLVLTNQPPVCPHMEENPMVFLAGSAPLYGALGSVYGYGPTGDVEAVATPAQPLRFNDRQAPQLLASQLVRRLSSFRVLDMDELLAALTAAA